MRRSFISLFMIEFARFGIVVNRDSFQNDNYEEK